jgi:hypothetical protein
VTRTCSCGKPTSGAWLCERCEKTFRWALVNVGSYLADLETVTTRRARFGVSGSSKGSIGKTVPLPVDMRFVSAGSPSKNDHSGRPRPATLAPGAQLKWDAWNTLVAWCRTIMEDQPEVYGPAHDDCLDTSCSQIRRRRFPRNTLTSMVHYLARQFRLILTEQWAPDILDEMLDLERRLARMVDRPADRWYAGKCSARDPFDPPGVLCTAELYATADRGWIECPQCATRHDVSERREFLLAEAKDIRVTATEAARALIAWTDYDGTETKLVDRIRKWRDHDKNPLEVRDVTSLAGRDRHLFRLGDIQERLIGDAQDAQTKRVSSSA